VVPPCVSAEFRPRNPAEMDAFRHQYGLPASYFVYVASNDAHKNYDGLLTAYRLYHDEIDTPWSLVIRGATEETLARHPRGPWSSSVVLLPEIPDSEMPLLYAAAAAMVYPSFFEGGGLPVIEALSTGCPVAASDIPTTREFAGDAALTFDPHKPGSIAEAMTRIHTDRPLRELLRSRSLGRRSRFEESLTAAAAARAYEKAVGRYRTP
jgi:glycosyltransferase involved in cell wall biosynthesis